MADIITLTGSESRSAPSTPDLTVAVDVRDYDIVTLCPLVTCVVPTTSPSFTLQIWGGNQRDSLDGWVEVWSMGFPSATTGNGGQFSSIGWDALPSYITWCATEVTGITVLGLCINGRAARRASMLP